MKFLAKVFAFINIFVLISLCAIFVLQNQVENYSKFNIIAENSGLYQGSSQMIASTINAEFDNRPYEQEITAVISEQLNADQTKVLLQPIVITLLDWVKQSSNPSASSSDQLDLEIDLAPFKQQLIASLNASSPPATVLIVNQNLPDTIVLTSNENPNQDLTTQLDRARLIYSNLNRMWIFLLASTVVLSILMILFAWGSTQQRWTILASSYFWAGAGIVLLSYILPALNKSQTVPVFATPEQFGSFVTSSITTLLVVQMRPFGIGMLVLGGIVYLVVKIVIKEKKDKKHGE